MFKIFDPVPLKTILDVWRRDQLIQPDQVQTIESYLETRYCGKRLPLYIHVLSAIGAFIGSLFLIAFLDAANLINFQSAFHPLLMSGVFITLATVLARKPDRVLTRSRDMFVLQCSFCLMAIGKILFVIGFADFVSLEDIWGVTLALFIISALTYGLYPMALDRFLSTFAAAASLFAAVYYMPDVRSYAAALLNGLFLLHLIMTGFIFTRRTVDPSFYPAGYALAATLALYVLWPSFAGSAFLLAEKNDFTLSFATAALALGLVGLMVWVAGDARKLLTQPLVVALPAIALLAGFSASGILLALWFLVLGYARDDKIFVVAGALLVPVFLFLYYYNLNVSLMEKSAILIGSGVILLLGQAYLYFTQRDRPA